MATIKIGVCTYYDDSNKSEYEITNPINKKWITDQNAYYESINDHKQNTYTFEPLPDHSPTQTKSGKIVWNKIGLINEHLNQQKTGDDNDDDPENDYEYDYIMYVDPSACLRVNNSYKDLFESIVTKYSCKNLIFSIEDKTYMPYFIIFFVLLLLILLVTIIYIFSPFNRVFFISLISLSVVTLFVILIIAAVDYRDPWCINSDVFIIKNSKYSRNMVSYWMSRDCYVNRKNPFQRHGCLKNCFIDNINKIRNNSVILKYGILEKNKYNRENESLVINFINKKPEERLLELNKLKTEFGI